TNSIAPRNITLDQSRRINLDSAKPFHAEAFQTALEMRLNRISPRKTNQGFLNLVALPEFLGLGDLRLFVDEQNQRQFEKRPDLDSSARFFLDQCDRKIDIACQKQSLGIGAPGFVQIKPKRREFAAKPLQQRWDVVVQNNRRRRNPQLRRPVLAQFFADNV